MSNAKRVMVLGTASNVGKSSITLALARWLSRQGARVLPFKSVSMGQHSYQTASGGEIHVLQAQQAVAAGIEPGVDMNPVMLKTDTSGALSSILLRGQPQAQIGSDTADTRTKHIRAVIAETYSRLVDNCDFMVLEGCGSPVELNVKERDVANLWVASTFDVPCVLVANIEDVGVFGSLVGTLSLMTEAERARIIGFVINKFHGDPADFADGVRMLEDRTGLPCLGVIPFLPGLEHIAADRPLDGDMAASEELRDEIERWTDHVIEHLDTQRLCELAFGEGKASTARKAQDAASVTYSGFEQIWQGRIHLGDEPGVFGDAHFAGLCVELPFNLELVDELGSSLVQISIEAENVRTFAPYPGHKASVIQYHPIDPTNPNGPWAQRVLAVSTMTGDALDIPVDLADVEGELIYLGLRLEIDTTVRAGLYNDFVIERIGVRYLDFRYGASFGFMPPR